MIHPAPMSSHPAQPTPQPAQDAVLIGQQEMGLYVHVPFCAKKCPYCDFNTYAGLDDLHQSYVDALVLELQQWGQRLNRPDIATVFIGGGTPTVLSAAQMGQIMDAVRHSFALTPDCEITCEANPGTVDQARFADLRSLGINRLSMGVQSFQADELAFLGRIHGVADVSIAFDAARRAGFDNINLDFMFGLPGQSNPAWTDTLTQAIALEPEHLSLYSLIVEPDTPLHRWVQMGSVAAPDADQAADHYELAMQRLGDAGYTHYEVSNWAKAGLVCRHNLIYWRNQDYIGVGPGAHSHLHRIADGDGTGARAAEHRRWGNRRPVPGYIQRMAQGKSVEAFREIISPRLAMGESMMLGLRLVEEGINRGRFHAMHGQDAAEIFAADLAQFQAWQMVRIEPDRIRLTRAGLMMGNQIFARFLPEEDGA